MPTGVVLASSFIAGLPTLPREPELLEVFRLGELACDAEIVRVVGDRLADEWVQSSRFREADTLTRQSLGIQISPETLLWAARARNVLGRPTESIALYEQRLAMVRAGADRGGEAVTLSNLGGIYQDVGRQAEALASYGEALMIFRELGNRSAEATVLDSLGQIFRSRGDRMKAFDYFNAAIQIRREVDDQGGLANTLKTLVSSSTNRASGRRL